MQPTDRYLTTRGISRTWRVWDMQARPDPLVVVDNIPSEKLARTVKAALVEAYYAGANAIKTGELII